jgi:NADH:ubiquinone reductase (non-electrogenic)
MVKKVTSKYIECETTAPDGTKQTERIPYGLLVWATGNAVRPVVRDLMAQIPEQAASRRGLLVSESLQVKGAPGVWAAGDCAIASTAGGGGYAPTAQVAGQQGGFLARLLNAKALSDALELELADVEERREHATTPEARDELLREFKALQKRLRRVAARIGPFEYSHQGSLAYIGSEKAVADISWLSGNLATGGTLTYLFWRSAYLSMTWSGESFFLFLAISERG